MPVGVIIGHAITAALVILVYFAAIKPASNGGDTYNYYGNCNTLGSVAGTYAFSFRFVICESIPAGLTFDPTYPIYNSTTNCWLRLMSEAQTDILIGSYYWSLLVQNTGDNYTADTTGTAGDVSFFSFH
ncbi:unnamed protein product [Heligmosomoides polygyrus]|uniref:CUB domain-containing protein n=1 Tax=Heligmosomoides polygyrus TaxID=6339 RepID=A0A183GG20_HELPZ|nr:unnamed protein product [Heligmosomoides polygyrus]